MKLKIVFVYTILNLLMSKTITMWREVGFQSN